MLVITRKAGEAFTVGDSVTIHFLSVDGKRVKVGIDAPRGMQVHRVDKKEERIDPK